MVKQQDQIIKSLHSSIQHIVSVYKLIKAPPPSLQATSLLSYAQLIENLLKQLFTTIPKLCVPMALFKKMERESFQNSQVLDRYLKEHRKMAVEMEVMEQKLKEAQTKQKYLKESYEQMMKNNHYYKKKAQSLKKSGEQSIKNMLEVVSSKNGQGGRMSLPRLDKKQKLSLLWLMGPTPVNEKLVDHLISKS